MPVVSRVRWVTAADGAHEHLAGVFTTVGVYYSRHDVAIAIDSGEDWWCEADGRRARIRTTDTCSYAGCQTTYLTTAPDRSTLDLEQLPSV
jgi:hypothetical protein